ELVAAKFIELGEQETELLSHLVFCILNGQIPAADRKPMRIEREVSLVPNETKSESPRAGRKRYILRSIIAFLYLLAGLLVGGYLLLAFSGRVFRLDLETAVIGAPLEQIVSQDLGA